MKPINYKSDFDVILHLETCVHNDDGTIERKDVAFPDHDFVATFWTASKVNTFVASCIGGVMTNCFNDNGRIHVVFDNHRLSRGRLMVELHTLLPNGIYADGIQDIYEPHPLDIELVADAGECPSRIEVEASVAVVYRSVYEDAVSAGYEGSQQDYYQLLSQLPDSVQVASSLRQSVEDISNLVTDSARGKARVIAALARRGFTLPSDATYDEIADCIETMQWGEGILAKIGYESPEDYKYLLEQIDQAYQYKVMYENGEIDTLKDCGVFAPKVKVRDGNADYLFSDKTNRQNKNVNLKYVPHLDGVTSAVYMFSRCENLVSVCGLDMSRIDNAHGMFGYCTALKYDGIDISNIVNSTLMFETCPGIDEVIVEDTPKLVCCPSMFFGCTNLKRLQVINMSKITACGLMLYQCYGMRYLYLKNIGVYQIPDFSHCYLWGTTDEESRQSVIYTLLTHSYDRAANGLSAGKITLHANTKAVLTEEEIAAITAKGYTIA